MLRLNLTRCLHLSKYISLKGVTVHRATLNNMISLLHRTSEILKTIYHRAAAYYQLFFCNKIVIAGKTQSKCQFFSKKAKDRDTNRHKKAKLITFLLQKKPKIYSSPDLWCCTFIRQTRVPKDMILYVNGPKEYQTPRISVTARFDELVAF